MGVPEILPLLDRLNPEGRLPLSMYHTGVPDEASVVMSKLYSWPLTAGLSASVVIVRSEGIDA